MIDTVETDRNGILQPDPTGGPGFRHIFQSTGRVGWVSAFAGKVNALRMVPAQGHGRKQRISCLLPFSHRGI